MMKYNDLFTWNEFGNYISKLVDQIAEEREKTLAEIITKYDFIVGSKELKHELAAILSQDANIIYSPYIDDPTKIYAIKKFDIRDLLPTELTVEKICGTCKHHQHENVDNGWVCVNSNSVYVADWTEHDDSCNKWESYNSR